MDITDFPRSVPEQRLAVRPDTPFHKGCVGHHLRTGGHSLNRYDWGCYMDFADKHGWRGQK